MNTNIVVVFTSNNIEIKQALNVFHSFAPSTMIVVTAHNECLFIGQYFKDVIA
jgi:hypothetical protein